MNLPHVGAGAVVIPFPVRVPPAAAERPISCADLPPELLTAVFREQDGEELLDLAREMLVLAAGRDVPPCTRGVRLVAAFKAIGIVLERELPELMGMPA